MPAASSSPASSNCPSGDQRLGREAGPGGVEDRHVVGRRDDGLGRARASASAGPPRPGQAIGEVERRLVHRRAAAHRRELVAHRRERRRWPGRTSPRLARSRPRCISANATPHRWPDARSTRLASRSSGSASSSRPWLTRTSPMLASVGGRIDDVADPLVGVPRPLVELERLRPAPFEVGLDAEVVGEIGLTVEVAGRLVQRQRSPRPVAGVRAAEHRRRPRDHVAGPRLGGQRADRPTLLHRLLGEPQRLVDVLLTLPDERGERQRVRPGAGRRAAVGPVEERARHRCAAEGDRVRPRPLVGARPPEEQSRPLHRVVPRPARRRSRRRRGPRRATRHGRGVHRAAASSANCSSAVISGRRRHASRARSSCVAASALACACVARSAARRE